MSFRPPFAVGDTVTHPEICTAFQCGNMGGMRRSKRTNTLIIISDHTKSLYDDKWYGDTLHYTGMGKTGDQTLTSQNRTLAESDHNGVEVHLFEVLHLARHVNGTEKQKAAQRDVTSSVYVRDPFVAEYAKRRPRGSVSSVASQHHFGIKRGVLTWKATILSGSLRAGQIPLTIQPRSAPTVTKRCTLSMTLRTFKSYAQRLDKTVCGRLFLCCWPIPVVALPPHWAPSSVLEKKNGWPK